MYIFYLKLQKRCWFFKKEVDDNLTHASYMLTNEADYNSVPIGKKNELSFVFVNPSDLYLRGAFNKFPYFFVQTFKIVLDSWKFSILEPYILWDNWTIFMISGSNEQLQQELEYILLKPDCHSWWISKM